ncbi:uncharacterized protein LOC123680719 [Harmonia axyridis]|uniref:uncharacterized protein LOC123680719 n=1 Tax=Harmonia axyridis TaxID=115357 RepID=UPI001E277369|nr:uncharacterized protein LOC123680719 [Harmonia axyridis]
MSTKQLIDLCKKYDKEFSTGIKKIVWDKISKEMSTMFGWQFTSQQCDTKWKGLKNTYKTVRRHNEQSGNAHKYWKHYDAMNDILFSKPEINAVATCSSANGLVIRPISREDNFSNDSINEDKDTIEAPQIYSYSFMRKCKCIDNAMERRHKDKMARQDRFLDLFERLTKAIEKGSGQSESSGI